MIGAVISIFLHLGLSSPAGTTYPQDTTSAITDSIKASQIVYIKAPALPVATLDSKTISAIPASSLADAARYFAGVHIKDYGGVGGLKTINVRSLGAQHTGVFYNGIKINNAQNGQVDLGRFSLENTESVTLYQAQKADLLQPASDLASAASVYIKSKIAEKTGVSASLRTGAFGTVNPSVTANYAKGSVKMAANAAWLHSNGRYSFTFHEPAYDTTATRTNGDIKALRAELALAWKGLSVNAYGYKSGRGLPGPVVRRVSDQYSSKDRQQDRAEFIQAGYKIAPANKLELLFNGKYSNDFCRYTQDPSQNAAVMKVDNRYWQREAFLSAAAAWRPADWLGAGLALDVVRTSFSSTGEYASAAAVSKASRLTKLASAQISLSPGAGWHLHGSILATQLKDRTGSTEVWTSHMKYTPTAILSYEGISWLKLRTFYKEIFRAPTFNDLYYTIGGRSNLKPEYSRQKDAGADVTLPLYALNGIFKLSADAYAARVNDKIVAVPAASQFRWAVINYGRVKALGTDVTMAVSAKIKQTDLSIRATWSYENSTDRTDTSSPWYGGRTAYSPLHSGSLVAGAMYKGLSASLSWLYTGRRYRDSANIPENLMEPWYTTDFSIGWKTLANKLCNLKICLDINNIFDQDYEVVTRYPMPGRHVLIKIIISTK